MVKIMEILEDRERHEYDGRTLAAVIVCVQYIEKQRGNSAFTDITNYWISIAEMDDKFIVYFRPKRTPSEIGLYGGGTSLGTYMEFSVNKEPCTVENIKLFK